MLDSKSGVRSLTVAQLAALLALLRPDDRVAPNRVGNLSIIYDGASIGFIDFAAELGAIDLHEDENR